MTETTLVDFVAICGHEFPLQVEYAYEASSDSGSSTPERLKPPLHRGYTGRVLAHYPHKRSDATFSEEIFALCMPKGVRFCTERELPTAPTIHTFVNVREDGSRVYGTAITFFEEVRDPNICEQMVRLHMEHVKELTSQRSETGIGERSAREIKGDHRHHHAPGIVSGGTHTLPRKKQIDRSKRISYYDGGAHKQLFVSKTLCLITRLPMVFVTEAILRSLVDMLSPKTESCSLPLESYLYWILHEVPLPSPGTTLKVSMSPSSPLLLQRPSLLELPFFDYSLSNLFDVISPEKFLRLLTCFFLEHQILVCSKDLSRLMLLCESLSSFAFPFRWSLAYAPILPYSQMKFIEAPVPYVMGLCYEEELPESLFQSNVCVFDVDSGRVEFPEDVPPFPQHKEICAEMRAILKRFTVDETENRDDPNTTITTTTGNEDEYAPKMRAISTRRRGEWTYKRMSRSFDADTLDGWINPSTAQLQNDPQPPPIPARGILGEQPMTRPRNLPPLPMSTLLAEDSPLSRVNEIARRAGVAIDLAAVESELSGQEILTNSPQNEHYFREVKLSNALRETVLHRVVGMLYSYEHFVVGAVGCKDLESWEISRDSVVSFDKASFLSDQPDSHLAFLAAFLETQMFTDFIDEKIKAQWQQSDENLKLFDTRIKELQHRLGQSMVRTPTADTTKPFAQSEELITKRAETVDYVVPAPHLLSGAPPMRYEGYWPDTFNGTVLEGPLGAAAPSPWKQRYRNRRPLEGLSNGSSSHRPTSIYGAQLANDTPTHKEQQLKFVEQLLKETKGKTKRMLVNKMGREAVLLGHGAEAGVGGVEENTLVAAFCDLLERVFSHGIIKKQGKSALWTYVLQHQDMEKSQNGDTHRSMTSSMLTPALAWHVFRKRFEQPSTSSLGVTTHRQSRPPRAPSRPRAVPYPGTRSRAPSQDARPVDQENNALSVSPGGHTSISSDQRQSPGTSSTDQNGNEGVVGSAISDLVESIQKELAMKDTEDTPAWSKNFLKAANFLCDRIQEASRPKRDPSPQRNLFSQALAKPQREVALPPIGPRRLKKCSSVSDFSTPGFGGSSSGREGNSSVEESPRRSQRTHRSQSRPRSPDGRVVLPSLPTHIAYDLKNVVRMAEIKTDIGYARAFVRLALERKLLHRHLAALLSNTQLIRELYRADSFTRCEDEKEQFLYHVLSLNAANYRCYTNTFTKTKMDYQVVVVTGTWRGALPAVWMCIEGSLATTPMIRLPEGTPLFKFDHRNLGILSTLRIGHLAEDERPSKWFLDYIVVRNEITGQMYRFPCGRWFGKGVDDGSLERLLVAEPLHDFNPETAELGIGPFSPARGRRMERDSSVTRERSPSTGRSADAGTRDAQPRTKKQRMLEIEQQLGDSVNSIVKHFYSEKESKSELARLLCGERGLVPTLEALFQFGRQDSIWTSRLFRQNYPWDYVEKISNWFFEFCRRGEAERLTRGQKELVHYYLRLVQRISEKNVLGKDGKFHVFILITIRDHVLAGLLQLMSWTPVTAQLYDEGSFLRSTSQMAHTSKLLEALNEFHFHIEKSLTYGIV
ncbi:unnamed protein product, partial [Mesorhabditis belari]|uniref:DENN domain-containing protein 5A n=1 Tax=Mesorhabditis belari TaxID=2138241 RepID=A0AAF3J468_9BILA